MWRIAPVLAAVALACAHSLPATRAPRLVGKPADVVAEDLGGAVVRIANDRGRVRVVDFWATWCEPCRDQLRFLDRLSDAYGPSGLSVYAVSFDEDRAMLQSFLEANPVKFAILWDKGGARLGEQLDISRLPTTLVVDRQGIVRSARVGFEADEPERLEREVKKLLAED
jgi:cytochrome c biogenesis protein CcmG/thiol:disulfide interchange protein DsbE